MAVFCRSALSRTSCSGPRASYRSESRCSLRIGATPKFYRLMTGASARLSVGGQVQSHLISSTRNRPIRMVKPLLEMDLGHIEWRAGVHRPTQGVRCALCGSMTQRWKPRHFRALAHRHYAGDRCQAGHEVWVSPVWLMRWAKSACLSARPP